MNHLKKALKLLKLVQSNGWTLSKTQLDEVIQLLETEQHSTIWDKEDSENG